MMRLYEILIETDQLHDRCAWW